MEAQQIFCNNDRPWEGSRWLRTPAGLEVSLSDESVLAPAQFLSPVWLPEWRGRTGQLASTELM